ncbi:MAG: hypothetical protein ACOC2Y_10100 [Spirochaetota bacterium]
MDFWDRMKNAMEKGLDGSRELLSKAKDRAQDLGERGVLRLEIMQLENQAEKLIGKLGTRAYEALVQEQRLQIDKQTEGIAELIKEIDDVHDKIREKEAALEIAMRRESGASADTGGADTGTASAETEKEG